MSHHSCDRSPTLPFKLSDPSLLHDKALLHGQWVEARSARRFEIEDPGTGNVFASCPVNTAADVNDHVQSSQKSFLRHRESNPRTRAQLLLKWFELIGANKHDIATLVVYETGKPMAEALSEVDYAMGFAWWFSGEAERVRGNIFQPAVSSRRTMVVKQPIGVCAALVPWNFPIAMAIRKASAALAAGCTMVMKPSPEAPLGILALADLASRAGFPPGALNIITTDEENTPGTSEALCKHALVRKVTFTGSTSVGSLIARHCSFGMKKLTAELGGNCPFIVFEDADLEQALEALMVLKWRTAGQACTHANRVYIQAGVYHRFSDMLLAATKQIRVGHGAAAGTTMGALTTRRGIAKLERHTADAIAKGGKVLCGGKRAATDRGNFWEPTIISNMSSSMLTTNEEIFGPLLGLYCFESEDEAVRLANDTAMGLAAYCFTSDLRRTYRLAETLEAGMIGINTGNSSCAESPFGGMKESGYGKEAGKDVAIEEYLVAKTITATVDPIAKL